MAGAVTSTEMRARTRTKAKAEFAAGLDFDGDWDGDWASALRCPGCGGGLVREPGAWVCASGGCGRRFEDVAGLADLRLESDRYLSLEAERARAEELAKLETAAGMTAPGLAEIYYRLTGDPRASRYLRHVAHGEARVWPLAERLPAGRGARVLELGSGSGPLLAAAAGRGVSIVGVDIASRWLVVARRRLRDRGLAGRVPLLAASAERLPFGDGVFDAVVADSLLEHLDDPSAALSEAARVLKPGGRLWLWSPNGRAWGPDPHFGIRGLWRLSRDEAEARVRRTSGDFWVPRTLDARGAAGLLAGDRRWGAVSTSAAPLSRRWSDDWGVWGRLAARAYRVARRLPLARGLLLSRGPLWQLEAERRGDAAEWGAGAGPRLGEEDGAYFERLAAAERGHWWSRAMWGIATIWIDGHFRGRGRRAGGGGLRALDVGCGTGGVAERLAGRGDFDEVWGLEVSREALRRARGVAGASFARGDAFRLPFADGTFDLLVCLDVVQHLGEGSDEALGRELRRVARPGALLVLRSNGPGWFAARRAREGQRTARGLRSAFEAAGWRVERATPANGLMALASELRARLRGWVAGSGLEDDGHPAGRGLGLRAPGRWTGRCAGWVAGLETLWVARLGRNLPAGHSTLIRAVKDRD